MQSSFLFALANTNVMRKFGAVVTTIGVLAMTGSPIITYAATGQAASLSVTSISDPISAS